MGFIDIYCMSLLIIQSLLFLFKFSNFYLGTQRAKRAVFRQCIVSSPSNYRSSSNSRKYCLGFTKNRLHKIITNATLSHLKINSI